MRKHDKGPKGINTFNTAAEKASYPSQIQPTLIWELVTWGTRPQRSCLLSPCSWTPWWRHAPWLAPLAPHCRFWPCRLCWSCPLPLLSPCLPWGSSPYPHVLPAPPSLLSRLSASPDDSLPLSQECCPVSFPFYLFSPSRSSLCHPAL